MGTAVDIVGDKLVYNTGILFLSPLIITLSFVTSSLSYSSEFNYERFNLFFFFINYLSLISLIELFLLFLVHIFEFMLHL